VTAPAITNATSAVVTTTPTAAGASTFDCLVTDDGGAVTATVSVVARDPRPVVRLLDAGVWGPHQFKVREAGAFS
jgi:hypothetical protein